MTQHGLIAGQVCRVEFLDARLQPCDKSQAVFVQLDFANGTILMAWSPEPPVRK